MNPVHGELSPAMRNRGVEIFVSPSPDQSKQSFKGSNLPVRELARYPEPSLVNRQAKLMTHFPNRLSAIKAFAALTYLDVSPEVRMNLTVENFGLSKEFVQCLHQAKDKASLLTGAFGNTRLLKDF